MPSARWADAATAQPRSGTTVVDVGDALRNSASDLMQLFAELHPDPDRTGPRPGHPQTDQQSLERSPLGVPAAVVERRSVSGLSHPSGTPPPELGDRTVSAQVERTTITGAQMSVRNARLRRCPLLRLPGDVTQPAVGAPPHPRRSGRAFWDGRPSAQVPNASAAGWVRSAWSWSGRAARLRRLRAAARVSD